MLRFHILGQKSASRIAHPASPDGDAVELTATEYELPRVLSIDAGRVMTYGTLQRRVWTRHDARNPSRVRLFVRTLSSKLGDDTANPAYVLNERGAGYRIPNQAACSAPLPDGSRLRRRGKVENGIIPAACGETHRRVHEQPPGTGGAFLQRPQPGRAASQAGVVQRGRVLHQQDRPGQPATLQQRLPVRLQDVLRGHLAIVQETVGRLLLGPAREERRQRLARTLLPRIASPCSRSQSGPNCRRA